MKINFASFSILLLIFGLFILQNKALNEEDICGGANGWTPKNGNCYKLFAGKMNFYQADNLCKSLGANIVSVHSEVENRFLHSLIETEGEYWRCNDFCLPLTMYPQIDREQYVYKAWWIGMKRVNVEDSPKGGRVRKRDVIWTDGTPVDYANRDVVDQGWAAQYPWHQGEPSGTNVYSDVPNGQSVWAEFCVNIVGAWPNGEWNDARCEHMMAGAICKKPVKCN